MPEYHQQHTYNYTKKNKASHGVSQGFIQFNPTSDHSSMESKVNKLVGPIGGVGQSGGGSPIIWLGVLMIMLAHL